MITVVKQNPLGQTQIEYHGEQMRRSANELVLQARWTLPERDLGYTRFQLGDLFTEYYYANQWFNIFQISSADGRLKGWYCNIAEPARFLDKRVEQIDLLLDVWVDPQGKTQILDEDEFAKETRLSDQQRQGALAALPILLGRITDHHPPFEQV